MARDHDLGLRQRVLSLPLMGALVLSVIWRQVGSATTLVVVATESDPTGHVVFSTQAPAASMDDLEGVLPRLAP